MMNNSCWVVPFYVDSARLDGVARYKNRQHFKRPHIVRLKRIMDEVPPSPPGNASEMTRDLQGARSAFEERIRSFKTLPLNGGKYCWDSRRGVWPPDWDHDREGSYENRRVHVWRPSALFVAVLLYVFLE